jgi:hypothetical protein
MPANPFDDVLIEVSRIPKKTARDVVGMFQPTEGRHRYLGSLGQVPLRLFDFDMLLMDPVVVGTCRGMRYVFLEYDDVRVGDFERC